MQRIKKEQNEDAKEYIEQTEKLQKKFQRLAAKVEREVLKDLKK